MHQTKRIDVKWVIGNRANTINNRHWLIKNHIKNL